MPHKLKRGHGFMCQESHVHSGYVNRSFFVCVSRSFYDQRFEQ